MKQYECTANSGSNFCFTLNNYLPAEITKLDLLECVYITYGYEVGEEGTPHLQGYIELSHEQTKKALNKKIGNRAWLGKRRGTQQEAIDYAHKDLNNIYTRGTPKQQGKRSDLDTLRNEIVAGRSVDQIVMENPMAFHQYGRTMERIETIHMRSVFRNFTTTCDWRYGPTATGKSEIAFKDFTPSTHYVWRDDGGWQDGYTQQHTIIIEEFRGSIPFRDLLMMVDSHPSYYVRRRGKETVPFVSKHVIITSSLPPEKVYMNLAAEDRIDQLLRRIIIWEHQKDTPPQLSLGNVFHFSKIKKTAD